MFHHAVTPLTLYPNLTEAGAIKAIQEHTDFYSAMKFQTFILAKEVSTLNDLIGSTVRQGEPSPHWKAVHMTAMAIAMTSHSNFQQLSSPLEAKAEDSETLKQMFAVAHHWVHQAEWPTQEEEDQYCDTVSYGYREAWLNATLEAMPQASEPINRNN